MNSVLLTFRRPEKNKKTKTKKLDNSYKNINKMNTATNQSTMATSKHVHTAHAHVQMTVALRAL